MFSCYRAIRAAVPLTLFLASILASACRVTLADEHDGSGRAASHTSQNSLNLSVTAGLSSGCSSDGSVDGDGNSVARALPLTERHRPLSASAGKATGTMHSADAGLVGLR